MNKKKILWVSPSCLLDSSSGFSLSTREMLLSLKKNDNEIKIISSTIFDSENAKNNFTRFINFEANIGKFVNIKDNGLNHTTYITNKHNYSQMNIIEIQIFFNYYCKILNEFKPDIVFFYKDSLLEQSIAREAKINGIKTVVYLVNPTYSGNRWIRDVDLIITDSNATVNMYKEKENYNLSCVGTFLNPSKYMVQNRNTSSRNLLFINPIPEKGCFFIVQLALYLEKVDPSITIEVVNSRANWSEILRKITKFFGKERLSLPNVIETKNTGDMREVYSRTKILLVPSLWFDSGPRVILEAQLNGIPVVGSNQGGIPELIGKGGLILDFPKEFYLKPYNRILPKDILTKFTNIILDSYYDKNLYNNLSKNAIKNFELNHNINTNGKKLDELFNKLILNDI